MIAKCLWMRDTVITLYMVRLLEVLTFSDIPDDLGSPDWRFAHNLYLQPPTYVNESGFPKHCALFPSHPLAAQKIK